MEEKEITIGVGDWVKVRLPSGLTGLYEVSDVEKYHVYLIGNGSTHFYEKKYILEIRK